MRHELDFYGIIMPGLLACLFVTYLLCALLRRGLARSGFYRIVWHPALFDLAIFVVVLGGVVSLSSGYLP